MNKWYEKSGPNDDVVIQSRIRLARNTTEYAFSPKISSEEAEALINKAAGVISGSEKYGSMNTFFTKGLEEAKKQSFAEQNVINQYMSLRNDGMVAYSNDQSLSVMFNAEDHIRIQAMCAGMDLNSCLKNANLIDDYLSGNFDYAFSEKYGYHTTFPTNVGTGLRAAYKLHLPALANTKKLQLFAGELGRFGVKLKPVYGDGEHGIGDIYELSNQRTIGQTEADIIGNIDNLAIQLVRQERASRTAFVEAGRIKAEDEAYKSYGVLKYSRCLTLQNAMVLLSELRMGQYIETIEFKDDKVSIYGLMLKIQPRTIQATFGKGRPMSVEEVDIARAKILRESIPELK